MSCWLSISRLAVSCASASARPGSFGGRRLSAGALPKNGRVTPPGYGRPRQDTCLNGEALDARKRHDARTTQHSRSTLDAPGPPAHRQDDFAAGDVMNQSDRAGRQLVSQEGLHVMSNLSRPRTVPLAAALALLVSGIGAAP